MRAYRPTTTPETLRAVPTPTTAVFPPAPLNIDSERLSWTHERKVWARIIAQAIEHRKQYQLEAERAQAQRKRRRLEAERAQAQRKRSQLEAEKAQARHDEQMDELINDKFLWATSCAGLVFNGFLFLILSLSVTTDVFRESRGPQLGPSTQCDSVPSLTDGLDFSVEYWVTVGLYIILRLVATMAVSNVAALSEELGHADAAYYKRQNECCICVNGACDLVAAIAIVWDFMLVVQGRCDGWTCLNLALAAPTAMSWYLLASISGVLFWECGYQVIMDPWKRVARMLSWKKEQPGAVGKGGLELLSQDKKDALQLV